MRRDGDDRKCSQRNHAAGAPRRDQPEPAADEPENERHDDEIVGHDEIHREQERQPAQPRAGQVGEIDATEDLLRLEKHRAEKECARQERQHVEHEIGGEPPFLHRVGHEEYGVEGKLLRQQIGCDRERPEQGKRSRRDAAPVAVEPRGRHTHDRAGQPEAEHREAHHQRAEMRPAPHREDAHDADLQRNDRAGDERDRQIERQGRRGRRGGCKRCCSNRAQCFGRGRMTNVVHCAMHPGLADEVWQGTDYTAVRRESFTQPVQNCPARGILLRKYWMSCGLLAISGTGRRRLYPNDSSTWRSAPV